MKVLHVAETAQGGVGSYIEEIVPLQARRYGADCVRAVLPREHAVLFPALAPEWVTGFVSEGLGRMARAARMAAAAMGVVRHWQPDLVHLHSTFAGLVMRPLLTVMAPRTKVVYTPHGWAFDRRTSRMQHRAAIVIERFLSRLADVVMCVSRYEFTQACAVGLPAHRLRVVLSGIREAAPAGAAPCAWPPGDLRVLFVGRLECQKGVGVLYSVMSTLGSRASAVIVGAAVTSADMDECQPPGNVAVIGWRGRTEIEALYARADVLVLPSLWEALPLVALEAMRAGLPVVASRVGGIPEIIDQDVTGLLVPPNDPVALLHALSSLDDATLRRMSANARQCYLQRFRVERLVDELDTLYCSLTGGPSLPRRLEGTVG
jgi:glycosyltransferase involved in cell wall biosynthesis